MARRKMMMINKGSKVVNLWNMASPQMTTSTPGYNAASKTIDADGTITYTNNSGSSAARIKLSMPAEAMGLVNGVQYTVKVWILNNVIGSGGVNLIFHAGGALGSGSNAYTRVYPPSPVSVTFTQADDLPIKVGFLYAQNHAVGDIYSIRIMVVEGDHIDDYVPYAN